ncbi:MAG: hypothetical protein KDC85_18240 [Saprospiraceae bacterium]|nr:hypothetical protein [Saprospiraceae bacterium]MCB9325875.1 hypothetical protein [Lewinellaceae bacterium]
MKSLITSTFSIFKLIKQILFFDTNTSKKNLKGFQNRSTKSNIMSDWEAVGGDLFSGLQKIING